MGTIIGSPPSLIKNEESVDRAERHLGQLLSSDDPDTAEFEVTIQPRNGDPIICNDHMGVLPYEGDQFDGSVGTLRNITEQRQWKQELTAVSQKYKTLIKHLPDSAVFLLDTNLEYVQAGGQELTVMGLSGRYYRNDTTRAASQEITEETAQYYKDTLDGITHTFEQD